MPQQVVPDKHCICIMSHVACIACDYHVTLSYSQLLPDVRAVDAKGQSDVLS